MKVSGGIHIDLAEVAPKIIDGYWHEWIDGQWVNTGIKAEGVDGYSVSLSKNEHSYNYNKNGNLKGAFAAGEVAVEVLNGNTKYTCDSISTPPPTVDNTYRVTSIVTSPLNSVTYNTSRSGDTFRLIPLDVGVDEVVVTFTIVARTRGVNTTFIRQITYKKVYDGTDGTVGTHGDGVVHIYRHSPVKPARPNNGVQNPTGWSRNPDKGIVIFEPTNWAKAIHDVKNSYAYSLSDTVSPSTGWKSSISLLGTRPIGAYLWIRDEVAYTNKPTTYYSTLGYVVLRDSGTVSIVEDYYGVSSDKNTPPTIWNKTNIPVKDRGEVLWSHEKVTFTDSTLVETEARVIQEKQGKWYESEELTAVSNSQVSVLNFTTSLPNQTLTIELWADGQTTSDYIYAGYLNGNVSTSSYYQRVRGGKLLVTYDIPSTGNHSIQIMWRKGTTVIAGSNRGYFAIVENVETWFSTNSVINNVFGVWSDPRPFSPDSATEERIYCLSRTTTSPILSDSNPNIDEYLPLPCSLSAYRGDFVPNRAYSIGQVVVFAFQMYRVIKAVTTAYAGTPTDTEFFEKIMPWTDNPSGANAEFPIEIVAIRRKVDGQWGEWTTSVWSSYGAGTKHLNFGWFNSNTVYKLTAAGVPMVKRQDSTALGYSVYTLKASQSTLGKFIPSEWNLVESAEFLFMQRAYIESLQAELITAERIESLHIKTGNLEVINGAKIAGLDVEGEVLVSSNKRLVVDGLNNTIYLLDDNMNVKTVIRPDNLPTTVSSYFASSGGGSASLVNLKGSIQGLTGSRSSASINLNASNGKSFEITIPEITLTAYVDYWGSGRVGISSLRLFLTNGVTKLEIASCIVQSPSGLQLNTVVIAPTTRVVTTSGNWRLTAELEVVGLNETGTFSGSALVASAASTFTASEIVNRSEIASNGMVIATSAQNYNFMVGDLFEVRRGSAGIRISGGFVQKFNGTSWDNVNW